MILRCFPLVKSKSEAHDRVGLTHLAEPKGAYRDKESLNALNFQESDLRFHAVAHLDSPIDLRVPCNDHFRCFYNKVLEIKLEQVRFFSAIEIGIL